MNLPEFLRYFLMVVAASLVHALFLRFAVGLMVEARVTYLHAYRIVAIEYVVAALVAGALHLGHIGTQALTIAAAAIALVAVGATLIGRTKAFTNGDAVGVGNGVLIQFMQVPLILPFAIVASFLIDPTR